MVLRSKGTVCVREITNASRFSGIKPEGTRPHAMPRHKLNGKSEIDYKGKD